MTQKNNTYLQLLKEKEACPVCGKKAISIIEHFNNDKCSGKLSNPQLHNHYKSMISFGQFDKIPESVLQKMVFKAFQLFFTYKKHWLVAKWETKKNPITNSLTRLPGSYYTYREALGAIKPQKNQTSTKIFRLSLTSADLRSHFLQKKALGACFPEDGANFFCFDIDKTSRKTSSTKARMTPKKATETLLRNIKKYILEKDIHLVRSGSKGYHVWLFFDSQIPYADLLTFAELVSDFQYNISNINIEFRPNESGANSPGIAIPLGLHLKTHKFRSFCYKKSFKIIPNPINYFLNITPCPFPEHDDISNYVPPNSIQAKITSKTKTVHSQQSTPYDKQTAIQVLNSGLPSSGTRNSMTLNIAIHLHEE